MLKTVIVIVICYIFIIFAKKYRIMVQLRIKECLKAHGMQQKDLAKRMGIEPISLSQMLARKKFGVDRLEQMADIIGCKASELFEESDKGDFASYIRYKGIHYTADTLDEFFKQVDELKTIAR